MTSAKLNACGLRWVAELANYHFLVKYKPGKRHGDADGLSRWAGDLPSLESGCTETINPIQLSTIMQVSANSVSPKCPAYVNVNVLELVEEGMGKEISKQDLKKTQLEDSVVGPIYKCVLDGTKPKKSELKNFSKKSKILLKQFPMLRLDMEMLVRETSMHKQLVLPEKYHNLVSKNFIKI